MKCVVCVNKSLIDKDMSTDAPILDGVIHAHDAAVVVDGKSLCIEHYHEHLNSLGWQEYNKVIGQMGRP